MFSDENDLRSLVLWLEEQKIRRYPIDQRKGLRDFQSNQWQSHYENYLKDLKCPFQSNNVQALCWLLGQALILETQFGSELDTPTAILDKIDGNVYHSNSTAIVENI